jgi:GNAT superfamily N-acetyltransferase
MNATLSFRRLDATISNDRENWRRVFRQTPSFTYATEGRSPTDDDADRMFATLPAGKSRDDIFLYSIYADDQLCGLAYVARDFPDPGDANLVLLVLTEQYHGRWLGVRSLKWIAQTARSWGCRRLTGVVDTANGRSAKFWQRMGFIEVKRTPLPGLVGEAIVGYLPLA